MALNKANQNFRFLIAGKYDGTFFCDNNPSAFDFLSPLNSALSKIILHFKKCKLLILVQNRLLHRRLQYLKKLK